MRNKDYLGSNIRSLRKAFGETQEQPGEILNIEKNTVSFYETGTREPNKDIFTHLYPPPSVISLIILFHDMRQKDDILKALPKQC